MVRIRETNGQMGRPLRSKDVDALMRFYTPDVARFDAVARSYIRVPKSKVISRQFL
jgi:ketosteroid isomerase-like protein